MIGNFHPLARVLRRRTSLLAPFGLLMPFAALANPSGHDVIHGEISFSTPGIGGLVVDQTSHTGIVNWDQFSIGDGEYVRFNLPTASSAILNRVIGGNPSEILGNLSSNGRVFLINPHGVMFGAGSRLDVGALAVSTHNIGDQDFLDGRYVFAGTSTAAIQNAGEIKAADGGFVILTADQVVNSGLIRARLGDVVLAAGSGMRFELDTGGLVSFEVDAAAASAVAGVENLGDIVAAGGNVLLTARVARDMASTAVNNSGRISATGVEERDGAIFLVAEGGNVANNGLLDASGGNRGQVGIYGDRDITLAQGSQIRANGGDGGQVRVIAQQTLVHGQGASIDVSAIGTAAAGGFLELSGHNHLKVRGDVTLGQGGRLVLDPTLLVVGDDINDTISFEHLENLLKSNAGASVDLVASQEIRISERAGAQTLNGRNENGEGASLFLGIGTIEGSCSYSCYFQQGQGRIQIGEAGGDDTLDIAGNIILWASDYYNDSARPAGNIEVHANLKSGGGVSLRAAGDILTRDILATGPLPTQMPGLTALQAPPGVSTGNLAPYLSGGIEIYSLDGAIQTGALTAPGVWLDAYKGILVAGDIVADSEGAAASVSLRSYGEVGDVEVQGDILVNTVSTSEEVTREYGQPSQVHAYSSGGKIQIDGDIIVTAANHRAEVDLSSAGDIDIGGDLTVEGGPAASAYHENAVVDVYLSSSYGNVTVDGKITARATAGEYSGSGPYYGGYDLYDGGGDYGSVSRFEGNATVEVSGQNITLGGLDVTGTGRSEVTLVAHRSMEDVPGKVTITGQTTVTAFAGQSTETYPAYEGTRDRFVRHYGRAALTIEAEDGEIETNGISVTGPNAYVDLHAGQLNLKAGPEGAPALQVVAAAAEDQRAWFEAAGISEETHSELVYLSSDYGIAGASLSATDPDGRIDIGGSVEVKGPSAAMMIFTGGDIDVAGDLHVQGTGYQIQGDWTLLYGYDYQDHGPLYQSLLGLEPVLESGTSHWGSAILLMGAINGEEFSSDGTIRIGGNLSVSGIGDALAAIGSNGLTVNGEQGITLSADLGKLGGVRTGWNSESEQYQSIYVGDSIDEQGNIEGEAQHGSATFLLAGNPYGDTYFRSSGGLKLEAATTRALVSVNTVELGSLQLLGGVGEQAPRYAERLDEGNSEISSTWTQIVGGLNSALIDVGEQGSLTIDGPVTVSGTGIVSLELFGGTVSLGAVSVDATSGEHRHGAQSSAESTAFGGAILQLQADSGVATAESLDIRATNAHLGVDLEVEGDVTIDVTGVLDNIVPAGLVGFAHPLSLPVLPAPENPGDATLAESRIEARNIDFSFGSDARLDTLALYASDLLKLDGNGISLQLAGLGESLHGSSLELNNLTLEGGLLDLEVENNLTLRNITLSYQTGLLKAGGTVSLYDSTLRGDSHTLQGDDGVRLESSRIDNGDGSAATVALTGALVEILGETQIDASDITLRGSNLKLESATLSGDVDADFSGDIDIINSQLYYDTGLLKAGAELLLQESRLFGDSHSLQAAAIRVGASTLSAGEGAADTVTLGAPLIEILGENSLINADTITLQGDTLKVEDATLQGNLDAVFTDSIELNRATLSGETASLKQTASTGSGIAITGGSLRYEDSLVLHSASGLLLGGVLATDQLELNAAGVLGLSLDDSLLIEAAAIDAIAEVIDLSGSTLTIGSGSAVNGIDTEFFELVPSELRPSSSGPNASFIASGPEGVTLGTITVEGGYLFVQAARASVEQINSPGRLFYNYRPFDNAELIGLSRDSSFNIEAPGTTLAFGGTGYEGDVFIGQPPQASAKSIGTQDYVFLTGGTVFGSQSINTSGQVLVLGGTIVDPQYPEHNSPEEEAADAQLISSNLSPDAQTDNEPPVFETAVIEEQSSSDMIVEEFQCR